MTNCLLVRNKPYGKVDVFDLALKYECAFLGYPAIKKCALGATTLDQLVTPFDASSEEWEEFRKNRYSGVRKQQEYRNKVCALKSGHSLIVMPRLQEGAIYVGTYKGLKFHNTPQWSNVVQTRFEEAGIKGQKNKLEPLASVCQTLEVKQWTKVPFVNVPAWIRASCFGRSAVQWIKSPWDRSASEELQMAQQGHRILPEDWTSDVAVVANRLIDFITPEPFEHLMVALLQLENPKQTWIHVGGSGDGGVDGIGYDRAGNIVGLLQCKWQYNGALVDIESSSTPPVHLAFLLGERNVQNGTIVHDLNNVSKLVVKHATQLPLALTLKIEPIE